MGPLFRFWLSLLIICIASTSVAQKTSKNDSLKALDYFVLFQDAEYQDTFKARVYSDSGLYYAYKSKSPEMIGRAHQFKGWYFQDCSKFRESNEQYYSSLAYLKKAKHRQGVADAYGNLGNSYLDLNEYQKSLDYQLLSLEENENIIRSNPPEEQLEWAEEGRSYALHNIAAIFEDIELYDKAMEYERISLAYELKTNNPIGVAISYTTMGTIHKTTGYLDSALYYFKEALEIYEKHSYPYGHASTLQVYASLEGSDLSIKERQKMQQLVLQMRRDLGDIDGEMRILLDIAEFQFAELSNDSLSRIFETVHDNLQLSDLGNLSERYFRLYSQYNSRIGKYDSAYFALSNFLELKAVSDEKKRTNDLVAQDIKYQMISKHVNDSLALVHGFAEERLKTQEDLNKKQNYIYLSVIGLIIVLVSLYYFVQSNRRNIRMNVLLSDKNQMIHDQKEMVELKNRSISDSINYAERLQRAILPTKELVNKHLPESFLFFQPKDVVSGDFHWFLVKEEYIYLAVADCTGHGVPGAIVSVVCSNALNSALKEFNLREPKDILNKVRDLVIEQFADGEDQVADGMDISLCRLNITSNELVFAGANNPLWLTRKKDVELTANDSIIIEGDFALIEYKGDKQPVGEHANMQPFTQRVIQLKPNDTLYLFTDGYADQFGGPGGKKFKYKPLKMELLRMQSMSLEEQGRRVRQLFFDWKEGLEQVDDVCILGVKVN